MKHVRASSTEVVYIDEFSLSSRKSTFYGWGPINEKLFVKSSDDFATTSFVVGLSASRLYGVLGKQATIDSNVFSAYIRNVLKQFRRSPDFGLKELLLVMDNASIHKTSLIKSKLTKHKVGILTIMAYSPWLNPAESYIS